MGFVIRKYVIWAVIFLAAVVILAAGINWRIFASENGNDAPEISENEIYSIGDSVYFGRYIQDSSESAEPENIEWVILDINEDFILLLSRYALDCRPYNTSVEDVSWETCSLRSWLNEEFINSAFDSAQTKQLVSMPTSGDNNTEDSVFLLSIDEAQNYFSTPELSSVNICSATSYAVSKGIWTAPDTDSCWWWLRSSGHVPTSASGVGHTGVIGNYGTRVDQTICGVRPAIMVNPDIPLIEAENGRFIYPESAAVIEDFFKPLREGMSGDAVQRLQSILISLGFLEDSPDGQFGPRTKAAIQEFQRQNNIEADGVVNADTFAALVRVF